MIAGAHLHAPDEQAVAASRRRGRYTEELYRLLVYTIPETRSATTASEIRVMGTAP